ELGGAHPAADLRLYLVDYDFEPGSRERDRSGEPVRPRADDDGFHARSERKAGPSACPPRSTGSKRSPCFSTRASASRLPKSRGRTFSPSSSQRRGVETGAPGFGRTEYADAIVFPCPFWRWSTSTPRRFFFSHSVVTSPGCSASSPRETRSASSYVSS